MGQTIHFKCNECNYEAYISAGRDWGFYGVVETRICQYCNELVTVDIGIVPDFYINEEFDFDNEEVLKKNKKNKNYYKCPICKRKKTIDWDSQKKSCPKCDGKMEIINDCFMEWD